MPSWRPANLSPPGPKGSRRIIYVISDGKESRSKANFREVVRYLESNQIAVYGTLVGDSATWGLGYLDKFKMPLLPLSPDNILPRYTDCDRRPSLLRIFREWNPAQLRGTRGPGAHPVHPWLLQSRCRYSTKSIRTLDVRVLRPNLDVVAEKGYYPTATNLSR